MPSHTMVGSKGKKIRGPRRLEYVPAAFRSIPGVDALTTLRQLEKLKQYLELPVGHRVPFIQLGASVPVRRKGRRRQKSTVVYAVDVDGNISIVYKRQDPRCALKWMQNPRRAWNLCRSSDNSANSQSPYYIFIATLASIEATTPPMPAWLRDGVPSSFLQNKNYVRKVWPCFGKSDIGGADRAFVVEGREDWFSELDIPDLTSVCMATGNVLSGENGCMWVSPNRVIEFPQYGFADSVMMALMGNCVDDPLNFVASKLQSTLTSRVIARLGNCDRSQLEVCAQQVVSEVLETDLIISMSLVSVDEMVDRIVDSLKLHTEVCA